MTPSTPALIDLAELRLDDALALLRHDRHHGLPELPSSPQAYLQALIDGLCGLSLTDPLTGLANRRHFHSVLEREIDGVARNGYFALLLMLDIDHFKKVNDTHGHSAGDAVLRAVAQCLAASVRPQDTVARYGGEEFAIVMPHCQVHHGHTVAERIRRSVEKLSVQVSPSLHLSVTVSIGGIFAPQWVRSTVELWTDQADMLLYQAKAQGRNRACINEQQPISVSAEEKSLLFGGLNVEPAWTDASADSSQRMTP